MRRRVTMTKKTRDNRIFALGNPGQYWSPRQKRDAIADIEMGRYEYFVLVNRQEVDVHVYIDRDGDKHLRTDPDKTTRNNLLELPSW